MNKTITLFTFLLFSFLATSQTVTISGYVKDASNGEDLIGVSVYTTEPKHGTVTNSYGFYSLTIPKGTYELNISFIGYATIKKTVTLTANKTLNYQLKEETEELAEVIVTDKKLDENLRTPEMGVEELSAKEIKKIPQFLGEVDVVRTLTLLPGVSTVGEGANGFNVRGGNVDQNLILLDDAPIFSSSHLFGFFSIFNGDAVKDVKLYKGGMPSQYGGRMSSVLDVRQKDGNSKQFSGSGGIGLLSTRLMLEGPIIKDKLSYMIAGRRSYLDMFLRLSSDPELKDAIIYFYDFNAKVNYTINERNKVYLSAYFGKDVFGAADLFDFGWGNGTATLRWNYLINPKLFLNTTLVYSDYTYDLGTADDEAETFNTFNWKSRIRNYVGKSSFTYYLNVKHKLNFGAEVTYYVFDPGVISGAISTVLQKEYALEPAIYLEDEWSVTDKLTVLGGLRYSWFYNLGERNVQLYTPGESINVENVSGVQHYSSGEIIASYSGLEGIEPRLAVNYRLNQKTSLKLSYNRNRQYIHLISNNTSPTPVDIWRPAGKYIQPATVNQIAIGYFRNFKDGTYKLSAETYYKSYQNLVDYKNGAELIFNDNIETELLPGRGKSYGIELMLEKQVGKLTGWLSYTLSKTQIQVDKGPTPDEWINDGNWFNANYDKTHDISLVLTYHLSNRWDLSANFAFQTGRPMSPPESRGVFEGVAYPVYTSRNSERIPSYNRLDLSANWQLKNNPEKRWKHSLNFSVYNAYGRKNAYSIFFRQNEDTGQPEAVRLSIFATVIPSVTYNFNF